jgi:hypothetical protein
MEETRQGAAHRSFLFLAFAIILIAMVPGHSARSDGFGDSWELSLRASVMGILESNGLKSDPGPIVAMPGIGMSYSFLSFIAAELALDVYGTYYGYSPTLGRAIPVAMENRSSFVVGNLLALHLLGYIPLPGDFRLRLYGGPSADLRLCLVADGLERADLEDATTQTSQVSDYFWSKGRWFFPVAGAGIDFLSSASYVIGADLRISMPAYHYWTGENLPTQEGWRVSIGLRAGLK